MLKYRLLFGTIMIAVFLGVILLDAYWDGSLSRETSAKPVQAPLLTILIILLAVPVQFELGKLVKQTGAHLFMSITIPASILLATAFFWAQLTTKTYAFFIMYLLLVPAFSFLSLFLVQAIKSGTEGTLKNVSASFFSIMYAGFLCAFILGMRIRWGPWVLLLFIFTIKCSDIGAYTIGRLVGRHTMAPVISPGKTWEGLGGAVLFAIAVSIGFSAVFDIMGFLPAVVFGAVFGILGQLGDLAESMMKRDASSKDSGEIVPGFGGILDVIDSPLATAPAGFVFFMILNP